MIHTSGQSHIQPGDIEHFTLKQKICKRLIASRSSTNTKYRKLSMGESHKPYRRRQPICLKCHKKYVPRWDNVASKAGPWMACETCDTWTHRKYVEYAPEYVSEKHWFCPECALMHNR